MADMVFASQSNPMFFGDGKLNYTNAKGQTETAGFFGGGTVAMSPAMYAIWIATEYKGIKPS